eukprot:NODE_1218_length_1745_cov_0.809842.p4 type:complete len:103 gc:universal NODE_1218_length_1745_cov_0.809842:625-933(+)
MTLPLLFLSCPSSTLATGFDFPFFVDFLDFLGGALAFLVPFLDFFPDLLDFVVATGVTALSIETPGSPITPIPSIPSEDISIPSGISPIGCWAMTLQSAIQL